MPLRLKIIIVVIMILFLVYIFRTIKKDNFATKYALIWIVADILVILVTLFLNPIFDVIKYFGIQTVSNMMFFIGFIFLTVVAFKLSLQLSKQNEKIIDLTQELGIVKNKLNKLDIDKNGKNRKL